MSKKKLKKIDKVNNLIGTDYEDLSELKLEDITKFMIEVLESKKGELIRYVPNEERFRYYQNGVWKAKKDFYIKQKIRNILSYLNRNNSMHQINKVFDDLAFETGNPLNKAIFSDYTQNKDYINFKNGMLNLNTMELEDHNPKYHSIFQLPHEYDSEARCPKWKETLKEWIPDTETIKFMQEYVGYLLVPDNKGQLFPILYGDGANGKSVFIDVIKELFGENISTMGLSQFFGSQGRWSPANLQNRLANICGDIDPIYMKKQGLIKSIIGEDEITVERKFQDQYQLRTITRLLFSANELPKSRDKSLSWYRRLEIIRFPNKFTPGTEGFDPDLKKKLKKELPGILRWAVDGLLRFRKNGQFTKSQQMIKDKNMYVQINDPISNFIDENYELVEEKEERIPTHLVYEKYKKWAEENGYNVENKGILTQHLGKKDVEAKNKSYHGKICRHYLGIKAKESSIEDELDSVPDLNNREGINTEEKAVVINKGSKLEFLS
ncbi:MAG: DNA primase family protein [Nanoarchaeota archaeon]